MPSIESQLEIYLKSKPSISALIGEGDDARIYQDRAKQGVPLPFIVYQVFDGSSDEHLGGITGVAENRFQIDTYGVDREKSFELAELVRLAPLQMFRGLIGSTEVLTVSSNGGYDKGSDNPVSGSGERRYWTSRDYIITHREPII